MDLPYDPTDFRLALQDMRADIRSLLKSVGTNLDLNENEPYGNGDQSIIMNSWDRDRARQLFAEGADIALTGNAFAFSEFALKCIQGDFTGVRAMLERTVAGLPQPLPKQDRVMKLLESRETSLRLSPLLLIVSAGKCVPVTKQPQVAKLLLRYGASPDAKDVVGKTAVHYGAGSMATPMTMEVAGMCIQAAETSDMYGKTAILEGLQNVDMNGLEGVVGGYDVDSGRRGIYIPQLKKELWVKTSNIRITTEVEEPDPTSNLSGREAVLEGLTDENMNGKEGILGLYDRGLKRRAIYIPVIKKRVWVKPENVRLSQRKLKLSDVRDRLCSVSLHEVVMNNRLDVAEFLLKKHGTSIHTMEADGISPMSMTIGGGMIMSPDVSKLFADVARAEAAASRMEGKKIKVAERNKGNCCASCNKFLGTDGMQCSKCKTTFYCDRGCQVKDWKEGGHKKACKQLAIQKFGVKLSSQHSNVQVKTIMSHTSFQATTDCFRKPPGVNFDEKFVVKVQGINDSSPLMIYDETRSCQFHYQSTGPGFREIFEAVQQEPTWGGRKTFMKASFNKDGECTMYPATAGVKNKYSW